MAAPPNAARGAADPACAKAKPLKVGLVGGANFKDGATTAVLKAVYTADMLYTLVQYADPTESVRRSPFQKQADGTWKKVKDPEDAGGDNNKFYEEKLGVIWNINNSIKGFNEQGCAVACHTGEGKPYGNKYTENAGELGDMWHLKSIRTGYIGQLDDGYLDHTRADREKCPNAGRKTDPKTAGSYTDVKLVDGNPEFMDKTGLPARERAPVKVAGAAKLPAVGTTYYLREENKVAFDDAKFKAGDEVASISVAPFVGDRGDVAAHIAPNKGQVDDGARPQAHHGQPVRRAIRGPEGRLQVRPGSVRQRPGAPCHGAGSARAALRALGDFSPKWWPGRAGPFYWGGVLAILPQWTKRFSRISRRQAHATLGRPTTCSTSTQSNACSRRRSGR